jgi:hypothetical protein
MLELSPKYVKFTLPSGKNIKEDMFGDTLAQLNLKNGDIITAKMHSKAEENEIPQVLMTDPGTRQFTPRGEELFKWMHWLYSSEEGVMTPETTTHFIRGCTGEICGASDNRITGLFKAHNKAKDDRLLQDEFVNFFLAAALEKPGRVFDNLRLHNIGNDLVRYRDRIDVNPLGKFDMPRQSMSTRDDVF